ncbi:unnamed protein product [Moneuplotes crassus]|uniref:Uncharacterized protein n=1 Tax=Euplotes crassus TaxID=5936 RepID=A0AAD1Y0L5_EUPCR|nr:unnamed protein product [Moneuplotes crassus]
MDEGDKNADGIAPSSWNYGSFHFQSRLYTSFMQKGGNKEVHKKYEPLNKTNCDIAKISTEKRQKSNGRRGSREDKNMNKLRMTQVHPRKVFTSAGWQRTTKSAECPKNKIATEDYYRALKEYKEIGDKEKLMEQRNDKAMSILLAGSPTPPKLGRGSSQDQHFQYNYKRLKSELDKIELPRETMYMIDKVVRQRVQRVIENEVTNGACLKFKFLEF